MKFDIEVITKDVINSQLNDYYRVATNSNKSHIKIFWGNLYGKYKVTHDVETVIETNNIESAIDAYNDIYIGF